MHEIMTGEASPVQMSAYLTALSMKGETITESRRPRPVYGSIAYDCCMMWILWASTSISRPKNALSF